MRRGARLALGAARLRAAFAAILFVVLWSGAPALAVPVDLLPKACIAVTGASAPLAGPQVATLDYRCGVKPVASRDDWIWYRVNLAISTRQPMDDMELLINRTRFSTAQIIAIRENGGLFDVTAPQTPIDRKSSFGNMVRFTLPGGDSAIRMLYIGVTGLADPALINKIQLAETDALEGWSHQWLLMGGVLIGAVVASILFNLLLSQGASIRFRLFYLLWMATILTYGLSWADFVPVLSDANIARLTYFSSAAAVALATLFFVEFFGSGAIARWLKRAQRTLAGLILIAATVATFDQLGLFAEADALVGPLVAATQILTAIGLIQAFRAWPRTALLYAVGWSFPLVAIIVHLLWGYGILGPNIVSDAGIFCAYVIQALLLSGATAVRLGKMKLQRDRAEAETERLRSLSETDPLTGLLNRRGFIHRVQAQFAQNRHGGLMMIDVDHFKEINDRLGHEIGDIVLARIAGLLTRHGASRCPVGRVGGEEFAVAVAAQSLDEALGVADDLRRAVAGSDFADLLGPGIGVTISIGVAVAPARTAANYERLYSAADRALYVAKNNGRNRVVAATEEEVLRAEVRLASVHSA